MDPSRPLSGRTVVVTRPSGRADDLVRALEARGARTLHVPSVRFEAAVDTAPLAAALAEVDRYRWVVFTSANGARFAATLVDGGAPPARVAAVGAATTDAVRRELGWTVDLVPEERSAGGVLAALDAADGPGLAGAPILLPLADRARDELERGLRERGALPERRTAYRTLPAAPAQLDALLDELDAGRVHLLTFTSPSTAEALLEAAGEGVLAVPAVAIGSTTAEAAEALGFRVVGVAGEASVAGLVAAAEAWAADGG